jgi:hypothetical protein
VRLLYPAATIDVNVLVFFQQGMAYLGKMWCPLVMWWRCCTEEKNAVLLAILHGGPGANLAAKINGVSIRNVLQFINVPISIHLSSAQPFHHDRSPAHSSWQSTLSLPLFKH